MSKYGVISGPYFPVFGLNTGKYGPEITPYLNTIQAVFGSIDNVKKNWQTLIKIIHFRKTDLCLCACQNVFDPHITLSVIVNN